MTDWRSRRCITLLCAAGLMLALPCPAGLAKPRPPIDWQRAAARFERALARDPTDAEAATNLAQALANLGKRDEAAAAYRRAIGLAPARSTAYAGLADLLADDPGRWEGRDEADALLQEGLKKVAAAGDLAGHTSLALGVANFERAVGRTPAARALLQGLDPASLSAQQRRRAAELLATMQTEEQARALVDWPEPRVPDSALLALAQAEQALSRGAAQEALIEAERLVRAYPGWARPRWLCAQAFEGLGHFDEAERELTILLQLAPSHAEGWRRLGRLLTAHGGAVDAVRADEALRQALALDPGFFDLWLLRAQVALRQGHAEEARQALLRYLREAPGEAQAPEVERLLRLVQAQAPPAQPRRQGSGLGPPPSEKARALYREAQDWLKVGDPVGMAPDLIATALEDSPGFMAAAVTAYTLTGQVPERTVKALWQDGEALLELAQKVRAGRRPAGDAQDGEAEGRPLAPAPAAAAPAERQPAEHLLAERQMIRPWLDRAVVMGVSEAYFDRGQLRIDDRDLAGGIADLRHYVGAEPRPAHLDEARVLLTAASAGAGTVQAIPAATLARARLLADRPREAAAILGGRCEEGPKAGPPGPRDPKQPGDADRLLALGTVHEWAGDVPQAVACYREAIRRAPGDARPLARLAGLLGRAPLSLGASLESELLRAAGQDVPGAEWALARLLLSRGDTEGGLVRVERFLRAAHPDDPNRHAARAERDRILGARAQAARRETRRRLGLLGGGGALALLAFFWLFRGTPLARGLGRRPALFPEVARVIGEMRHDVLKHRTSVLGLVSAGSASREQVARVLWEPERSSDLIAVIYDRLQQAARARGVVLRRLSREPTFGPLVRDLRRAEALVRRPAGIAGPEGPSDMEALRRIDQRLREVHSERLGALLRLGPKTRVDGEVVSRWIREAEAEVRVRSGGWTSPVLLLGGLDLDFPVERGALATIFANLMRNAQAVVAAQGEEGSVIVRVGEERDATGRRMLVLLVGDSARAGLSTEAIEGRESGRGLAIVRDLVHEWRGHLVVRPEAPPWSKGVGACFPA